MMKSKYPFVRPPLGYYGVDAPLWQKEFAEGQFDWFLSTKDERLRLLSSVVHNETGFDLDFSRVSLLTLFRWFSERITSRPITRDEITFFQRAAPNWLRNAFSPKVTTPETDSIIHDVGIYFGETFLRHSYGKWVLYYNYEYDRDADNGQACVIATGVSLNPFRKVWVLGKRAIDGPIAHNALLEIFDYYLNSVE